MQLATFLNKLFKTDGFILIDANQNKYIIGSPEKDKPITLKLLDKKLHYKLLFYPDLYFGEAYMEGTLKIENGKLADLVILDQDPIENIRNTNSVEMVMKNGRIYDGDNLEALINNSEHPVNKIQGMYGTMLQTDYLTLNN